MPLPALHTAGCLALGALLLFAPWPGGRGVSARRMVRVALVLAVVLTAELAVFYAMHTGFFLWITLVHRATFVVLPLLAVAVLVLALRHRPVGRTEVAATERPAGRAPTRPAVGLALVTLTLPPVGAHAAWVAPFDLRIERVDLDVAADLPRPVTVAILADLQCRRVGPYEEHAIDALLALEPDVILIPGLGEELLAAIQRAYYREARNPSDVDVLADLAGQVGLDAEAFAAALTGAEAEELLQADLARARALGATSFPSLAVAEGGHERLLASGCLGLDELLPLLRAAGLTAS